MLVVTGTATPARRRPRPRRSCRRRPPATTPTSSSRAGKLLAGTKRFVAALEAGDLAGAKAHVRPGALHYERIEPVAESFGDLDPEIDARVNDVDDPATWTGFHRIEQILWVEEHDRRHAARSAQAARTT